MHRNSPALLLTFLLIAACQPIDPAKRAEGDQPSFDDPAIPAATSIPMSSKPAQVAATLSQRIQSFDVSPDLKIIALATSRGIVLYDFNTQKYLRTVDEMEYVSSVAWSPDGSKLAVGGAVMAGSDMGTAHLVVWDTSTWKTVFEPDFCREMFNETFHDMAWSPDSRSLAVSTSVDGVLVFDTQTGKIISHQTDFVTSVDDVSWSPDGSRLVATADGNSSVRRWKLSDDEFVRLFDPRLAFAMTVAWSPDGKRIASGHYSGGVCFWTAATNKCDGFIQAHRTATFSLAWSPDGNELATGGGVIRIWDTHTGKLITAFGEDNRYIYARIEWPAVDQPIVSLQAGLENPANTVVRFWDVASGTIQAEFRGNKNY